MLSYTIAFIVFFIDQITKLIVSSNFKLGESVPVILNIFHLTYAHNKGISFGVFQNLDMPKIIIAITIIIILFLVFLKDKIFHKCLSSDIFFGLILGGAIGNLVDRLRFNYVIDFFDFRIWPIFNVADTSISVGIIGVIIWSIFLHKKV